MPEYLAPGVFVEEIDSGSMPIEGVGTNTAAFIGYAKSGEFNKPLFISDWSSFVREFGEEENAYLMGLTAETGKSAGELAAEKRTKRRSWAEYAQTELKGAGKNFNDFLRTHKIPLDSSPYMEGSYLAHSVWGFYQNGGSRAYILRIPRQDDVDTFTGKAAADARKPAVSAQAQISGYVFKAIKPGTGGNTITVDVEPGDGEDVRVKVSHGNDTETFPSGKGAPLTWGAVAASVNGKSRLVQVEVLDATAPRPVDRLFTLSEGLNETALTAAPVGNLVRGSAAFSAVPVKADEFVGDEAERTGLGGLAPIDDVDMILMPDLMAGLWKRESNGNGAGGSETLVLTDARRQQILDAQCALVAACERRNDVAAILDPIPGLTPLEMKQTTLGTSYNSDHGQGSIYYPWIKISDPLHRGQQLMCPPGGHVAGVWARVVNERGVQKAPANEGLLGAVGLEWSVSKGEQEILNPIGVNCIRSFPGTGIRIWGARTLATVGNQSWKYVNVRRLFNYLKRSMDRGMQWVVFEPNDHDLWGRVRRNLNAFLYMEWKEGKLFGNTPAEAFYVKCDSETNPQEAIDLGRLYVEIGINPVKPAEFVIIRIGQWSDGGSMIEQ